MKHFISTLLLVVILFPKDTLAFQVMIDPGHGGSDRGAVRGDAIESHIAFDIAKRLVEKLQAAPGIEVILTRDTDRSVQLRERVKDTQEKNPDIFISIHVNSSDDPKARGVEFYFAPSELNFSDNTLVNSNLTEKIVKDHQHTRKIYQSRDLAKALAQNWNENLKSNSSKRRRILQAPFFVISKTRVPSLLVELGFLTHAQESIELRNEIQQERISAEIFQGILSFKNRQEYSQISK